jgi:heme/copper-type cytochrome/quinol oxidase subunit 3
MTEESSDQLSWKIAWKDITSSAVPLLSVLGMAFYALSSYAYGHFYNSLGTTPADVGLTYVGILAVSTGWAIALALGLAFVVLVVIAWFPAIRLGGMVGEHLRMGELFAVP